MKHIISVKYCLINPFDKKESGGGYYLNNKRCLLNNYERTNKMYKELFDSSAISQEEFEEKKYQIL